MSTGIPFELQSTFVELESKLRQRYNDLAANPLVYFLQDTVAARPSSGEALVDYAGSLLQSFDSAELIVQDVSLGRVTLNSLVANFHKLKVNEVELDTVIVSPLKKLAGDPSDRALISFQENRKAKLQVIDHLLAQMSPASLKVEEHYTKSVLFRKGTTGQQELYSLIEQLPELTEARNEVFLRPSQAALETYLHRAELAPSQRDVRELFNGNVGLTEADFRVYAAGLEKLQDELHVAVLVSGV